jgi:phenylalanyl-tRNA synthetase beta chain
VNLARGAADVRLYELGRVYLPQADERHAEGKLAWPVAEPQRVALVAQGRAQPRSWSRPGDEPVSFFDVKGALDDAGQALGLGALGSPQARLEVRPASALEAPPLHPAAAATVWLGARCLGSFGQLHPLVAQAFDVPAETLVAELDWEPLAEAARLVPKSRGVPKFPSVLRDLALLVDAAVPAATLLSEMRAADGSGLLESVELFDLYRGAQVASGKKSVAVSLALRAPDRTLTDADADAVLSAVKARLKAALGAEIRA